MALLFALMLGASTSLIAYLLYALAPEIQNPDALLQLKMINMIIIVLMLSVVLVSFIISLFVVSRINRIALTARNIIDTGDISERISIDTKWDDLSNLAQVLNGFLAQLDALMSGAREVSNNIAHDLRTPLTGLRADIESLKGKTVSDEDLDALLAEADRILSIFQSLLRITNIEKGKRHKAFRDVNLGKVLEDVIELYEPVAEDKKITLTKQIDKKLHVQGDADLLFQMFANVLDNAIKFTDPGGAVQVVALAHREEIRVQIIDAGPGIPDAAKDQVFQHFFRLDESRGSAGFGLGLSLVKAVVDKHRGTITLGDANPGLVVTVVFEPYE